MSVTISAVIQVGAGMCREFLRILILTLERVRSSARTAQCASGFGSISYANPFVGAFGDGPPLASYRPNVNNVTNTRRLARARSLGFLTAVILAASSTARAQLTTIGFDDLNGASATPVVLSSQYSSLGVTFSGNPEVLAADINLGPEFPARSSPNVVANVDVVSGNPTGPITATFSGPVSLVEAYFTYTEQVTITAYNSSDVEIGSMSSLYPQNWVGNGAGPGGSDEGSPNELIDLSNPGIASIVISTTDSQGEFTMDDFTFGTPGTSSVPDSLGLAPIVAVLGCVVGFDRLTRKRLRCSVSA